MRAVATRLEAEGHLQCGKADSRFASKPFELVYGRAATSVQGVSHYMRVSEAELQTTKMKGVAAIERELRAHGKESDIECLDYVLHAEALPCHSLASRDLPCLAHSPAHLVLSVLSVL